MSSIDNIHLKFVFLDKSILEVQNRSFRKAIELVSNQEFVKQEPIKVVFPTTKKVLYYDTNAFNAYLNNQIDQLELIEKTSCSGLYRNLTNLKTDDQEIEAHSLWKKIGNQLYLVNDDYPAISDFIEKLFYEV